MIAAAAFALAGCAGRIAHPARTGALAPVQVKIIAFNDFHGNLEPPRQTVDAPGDGGATVKVPAGGAAYLASAIAGLRAANPNHVVVSAGDMVGGSPLVSSLFLDEPTILAMDLMRVDFNAVGNHEFDRGRAELLRLQRGGCEKHTVRQPCAVDEDFSGARFGFLAANTITETGAPLFPAYAIKRFGSGDAEVRVGFIGLTLKETATLVTPAGVAGLSFADEAATANALVPKLRAEGADAIVVLIHQGVSTDVGYNDKSCAGLEGNLLPILERLDPAIDVVVSGHTHNAYVCDYGRVDPARPFLLTSAGRYGTLLTDVTLTIDPAAGRVIAKRADNLIVQGEGHGDVAVSDRYPRFTPDPAVAALVRRYVAAAKPVAARPVGRLTAPALKAENEAGEQVLGNLIADAQLAATRAPEAGGAQVALMNGTGVRDDLVPAADGSVSFGQLFAAQPFANLLVVKSFTGRQLRAVLEQQFASGANTAERPNILSPSHTMRFAYDLSRPAGQRIVDVRIAGAPLRDDAVYRVAMNSFLASGGDNFTLLSDGADPLGGPLDVDALEAYIAATGALAPPQTGRVTKLTPKP